MVRLDQRPVCLSARIAHLGSTRIQVARPSVGSARPGPVDLIVSCWAARFALLAVTLPHMEVLLAPTAPKEPFRECLGWIDEFLDGRMDGWMARTFS